LLRQFELWPSLIPGESRLLPRNDYGVHREYASKAVLLRVPQRPDSMSTRWVGISKLYYVCTTFPGAGCSNSSLTFDPSIATSIDLGPAPASGAESDAPVK
jgi:hypothetical protein